jgi:small-conductance mechanosensitive channel
MDLSGDILTLIIEVAIIIVMGFIVARLLYWVIKKKATKYAGASTAKTMANFIQYLILIIFFTMALLILFGVNSTTIAFIVGAVSFAITFGFQNVIQNVVGGVIVAIDGRVQLGDWVEVGDTPYQTGPAEVLNIGLTSITVREYYGRVYVIPSSYLIIHKALNYSDIGCFNINVPIALPWTEDPDRMREIFLEEATRNPMVYPNIRPIRKESKLKRRSKHRTKLAEKDEVKLDFEEDRFLPSAHIVRTEQDKLIYNISLWTDTPINSSKVTSSYLLQIANRMRQEGVKETPIFKK